MKAKKTKSSARGARFAEKRDDALLIRHCHGIREFEACVAVERAVWQSSDIDVVPIPLFVVASETGGQVLGAFDGTRLVGFTMAIAGWRYGKPFLHSHMTAVLEEYRDHGVGRHLKLFQRSDALSRGIAVVEWTFDPLVIRNAYFNFMRLGAIARRFLPNAYGLTTSPLHGSLPTDRLVAEWHLKSRRTLRVLSKMGKKASMTVSKKAVRITIPANIEDLKTADPPRARELQSSVRAQFEKWFGLGYAAAGVAASKGGMDYILEPGIKQGSPK